MAADLSPIANAIENFGSGYANLALKKAGLKRQAELDAFDIAAKQAAIDLSNAKTANERFELNNRQDMAGFFDPQVFTPEQLSAMGAGVKMGSRSLNDVAGGHLKFQEANQNRELFRKGIVNSALKDPSLSFGEMRHFFRKPVMGFGDKQAVNPTTNAPVYEYDDVGHRNAVVEMLQLGLPQTRDGFRQYLAMKQQPQGMQVSTPPQDQVTSVATPGLVQQSLKVASQLLQGQQGQQGLFPAGYFNSLDELIEALESGQINEEQFSALSQGY